MQEIIQGQLEAVELDSLVDNTKRIDEILTSTLGSSSALPIITYIENELGGDPLTEATKIYLEDLATYSRERIRILSTLNDLHISRVTPVAEGGQGITPVDMSTLSGDYLLYIYSPNEVLIASLDLSQLNLLLDKGIISINDVSSKNNKIEILAKDIKVNSGKTIEENLKDLDDKINSQGSGTEQELDDVKARLDSAEAKNVSQDSSILSIENKNTLQDTAIADLDSKKADKVVTYTKAEVDALVNANSANLTTKYRNFSIKYAKTGLSLVVNSSTTAYANITNVLKVTPTITGFGSAIIGNDLAPPTLVSAGTGATSGFKFPVISGMPNFILNITVRIWGTMTGSTNQTREFIIYLRRISDNSIIANGGVIKVIDGNVNGRTTILTSFVKGSNDPFITGGFYLDAFNNSGSNLTITQLEVLFQGF